MTDRWLGCIVSVDCGDSLGVYEGRIIGVDAVKQTISLSTVSHNGICFKGSDITLRAPDICDLKILKTATEHRKPGEGQTGNHRVLQQSRSSAFDPPDSVGYHVRWSPVKHPDDPSRRKSESYKKTSTPKRNERRRRMSERDEACFSAPVDNYILENDFDFEKNLALFDKQAVFEEISALSKPDVVRLVDCNRRGQAKYKCEENVLENEPIIYRQIAVPCVVEKEYVTDTGLVVPSITKELREGLSMVAQKYGLGKERQLEMLGRTASEMVLQLLGGSHRLNPQNSHQKPTVVVLCGPHLQGAQAANCGRHLANHGVNVVLLSPPRGVEPNSWLAKELALYKISGSRHTCSLSDVPPTTVDIIIGALDTTTGDIGLLENLDWCKDVVQWVLQSKAQVLCLDPPPEGSVLRPKWMLSPVLPFAFRKSEASLYLCDLGLPREVFADVGIRYTSPYGSKFITPLYERYV